MNTLEGRKGVVLANKNTAQVRFLVTDADEKGVPNETLTITLDDALAGGGPADADGRYYLKGADGSVDITTDAEGYATINLYPKKNLNDLVKVAATPAPSADVKNTADSKLESLEKAVAAYKVTATSANAKGNLSKTVTLSVAAISYETKNGNAVEETTKDANKVEGLNAAATPNPVSRKQIITDGTGRNVEYIASQQASTEGKEDHAVSFRSDVCLLIPGTSDSEKRATKYTQTIKDAKYDTYGTYTYKKFDIPFDIDNLEDVASARLHFNRLQLSKYTTLKVYSYKDVEESWGLDRKTTLLAEGTLGGNDKSYYDTTGYIQIAETELAGQEGIRIELESEGEVNTDRSLGFEADALEYLYKTGLSSVNPVDSEPLDSATITWKIVDPDYTTTRTYTDAMDAYGILEPGQRAEYVMPAFPQVGNAIITIYDSSDKAVGYYAVPTERITSGSTNTNRINPSVRPFEISKEAAANTKAGSLTPGDGKSNEITVNSEKTGMTFLKGTVECDDPNIKEALDDSNNELNTYIMWDPVENPTEEEGENDVFLALIGQSVEVVAQLYDQNGNVVTSSAKNDAEGITINFKDKAAAFVSGGTIGNNDAYVLGATPYTDASVAGNKATATMTKSGKTDSEGQVTLTLKADDLVDVVGLEASVSESKYNVKLSINGRTTEKADIYWLDLGMSYTHAVGVKGWDGTKDREVPEFKVDHNTPTGGDGIKTVTVPAVKEDGTKLQTYTAGQTWEIGTKLTQADGLFYTGKWAGAGAKNHVGVVSGVTVNMTQTAGSVGTFTKGTTEYVDNTGYARSTVYSDAKGEGTIEYSIDNTSIGEEVVFYRMDESWEGWYSENNAGTGDTKVNLKMAINYQYGEKVNEVNKLAPMGTNITRDFNDGTITQEIYAKVTDSFGHVLEGYTVEFILGDKDGKVSVAVNGGDAVATTLGAVNAKVTVSEDGTDPTTSYQVETDKNGVVKAVLKYTVDDADAVDSVAVPVSYKLYDEEGTEDEEAECESATYTFINDATPLTVTNMEYAKNKVVLTFSEELEKDSVQKEQFSVFYDNSGSYKQVPTKAIQSVDIDTETNSNGDKISKVTINLKGDSDYFGTAMTGDKIAVVIYGLAESKGAADLNDGVGAGELSEEDSITLETDPEVVAVKYSITSKSGKVLSSDDYFQEYTVGQAFVSAGTAKYVEEIDDAISGSGGISTAVGDIDSEKASEYVGDVTAAREGLEFLKSLSTDQQAALGYDSADIAALEAELEAAEDIVTAFLDAEGISEYIGDVLETKNIARTLDIKIITGTAIVLADAPDEYFNDTYSGAAYKVASGTALTSGVEDYVKFKTSEESVTTTPGDEVVEIEFDPTGVIYDTPLPEANSKAVLDVIKGDAVFTVTIDVSAGAANGELVINDITVAKLAL